MKYRVMTTVHGYYNIEERPWWWPAWEYITVYPTKEQAIETAKKYTEASKFKPVQVWP